MKKIIIIILLLLTISNIFSDCIYQTNPDIIFGINIPVNENLHQVRLEFTIPLSQRGSAHYWVRVNGEASFRELTSANSWAIDTNIFETTSGYKIYMQNMSSDTSRIEINKKPHPGTGYFTGASDESWEFRITGISTPFSATCITITDDSATDDATITSITPCNEFTDLRLQSQTGGSTSHPTHSLSDLVMTPTSSPTTFFANAYNGTTYLGPIDVTWSTTGTLDAAGLSSTTASSITFDPSTTAAGSSGTIEISYQPGCSATTLTASADVAVYDALIAVSENKYVFPTLNEGDSVLGHAVSITNNSGEEQLVADLSISGDTEILSLTPPFSEGDMLAVDATEQIDVEFSPSRAGSFETAITMSFGNPVIETQTVTFSAETRGIPTLVSPADSSTEISTTTNLSWNELYVPENETASSAVYLNTSSDFTGVDPVALNTPEPTVVYAGIGILIAFSTAGSLLAGKSRRRRLLGMFLLVLVIGVFLLGCKISHDSKDPGEEPEPGVVVQPVDGLEPGTTYYWKVVTTYSSGDELESEVWSFVTADE